MGRISEVLSKKKKKEEERKKLVLWLDQDSVERLERLRGILKNFDDSQLIALALKLLEHRMKKMVKRRLLRKIRTLEKKGLLFQQIADQLDKQGVPAPGRAKKWKAGTIARFSEENTTGMQKKDLKKLPGQKT